MKEKTSGCSEEADVASKHPCPSVPVESEGAMLGDLRQSCLCREASAPYRLPVLWAVRPTRNQASGSRSLNTGEPTIGHF